MCHRLLSGQVGPTSFVGMVLVMLCQVALAQPASDVDPVEPVMHDQEVPTPVAPQGQPAVEDEQVTPTEGDDETESAQDDDAHVTPQAGGTFDVAFQDLDVRRALRILSTQTRKNIVTTKEVTGNVTAILYGVTFHEALNAVLHSGGFVYEEEGNSVYVMTSKQMEELIASRRKLMVRTFKLSHVTAEDARMLIAPALSKDGSVAVTPAAETGIPTSKTESGGNDHANDDLLVVRDYEDNLDAIAQIIEQVDVRPDQVLIEATILRATLNEKNSLGIDFNTVAGVNFAALNATTTGLTGMLTEEVPVGGLGLPAGTVGTDFASSVEEGGLSMGLITSDIALFIRALEGITDVTVLANPKLLVINKQRGEVMIGNRDGYLTTTVTETVATQTVQFLETGTRLVVRPFIGADGVIRLEIHPEDSAGSVTQIGAHILPRETTTEVTSNVLVRDGHTIVIGGLFRESTTSGRSQVPVLGNIPYLGTLFRSTSDATVREEVIILITPRIVKQSVAEAIGAELKDDVERFRVGQRKGVRWWGRERLAQMHLRQAREDIASSRRDRALWNIDMALSLNPSFIEAIKLKERMTETAHWANEGRLSSTKYILERVMMNELNKPVEMVIPPARPVDVSKLPEDVRDAFGENPSPQAPLELIVTPHQWPEAAGETDNQEEAVETCPPDPQPAEEAQVKTPVTIVDVNDELEPVEPQDAIEAQVDQDAVEAQVDQEYPDDELQVSPTLSGDEQ